MNEVKKIQNLPPPPETIEELFKHLDLYARKIGDGHQAEAYRFLPIIEGLDKYVVRIPLSRELKEDLLSTTSLTPSHVVSRIHIGNKLMEFDNVVDPTKHKRDEEGRYINKGNFFIADPYEKISIHLFQAGTPLFTLQDLARQTYEIDNRDKEPEVFTHVRAMIDTVNTIKSVVEKGGFNPYVRMFKKAYALSYAGFEADISLRNILFSKEKMTLRMVDQENRLLSKPIDDNSGANIPDIQSRMYNIAWAHRNEFDCSFKLKEAHNPPFPPGLEKEYNEAYDYIKGLLAQAWKESLRTDPGREKPDGSNLPTIPRRIEFAKVDSSEAVSMQSPPWKLLKELNHIVQEADITR